MPQLKMIFNAVETAIPELTIAEGFVIRPLEDSELEAYNQLRASVGFPAWEPEYLAKFRNKVLKDALFVVEEKATGRLCASAAAEKTDMPERPELGVLGWVMTHPDYNGKRLGRSVSVAVMHRLYQEGYRAYSLLTDDFRVPAVSTYIKLGWQPWLYLDDMEGRWRALADVLKRDFDSFKSVPADCQFPFPVK